MIERGSLALESILSKTVFSGVGITPYYLMKDHFKEVHIHQRINLVYREELFHPSENIRDILKSCGLLSHSHQPDIWIFEKIHFHLISPGPFCPFSQNWFEDALFLATSVPINPKLHIKILPAPYFFTAELETFLYSTGSNHHRKGAAQAIMLMSLGRENLIDEIYQSHYVIRSYILRQLEVIHEHLEELYQFTEALSSLSREETNAEFQNFLKKAISDIPESSSQLLL